MTDTGQIIRTCREVRKWPRSYLAEKAGIPFGTVITCERKQDCRVSTFEKLIEAMGFEIEILPKEEVPDE